MPCQPVDGVEAHPGLDSAGRTESREAGVAIEGRMRSTVELEALCPYLPVDPRRRTSSGAVVCRCRRRRQSSSPAPSLNGYSPAVGPVVVAAAAPLLGDDQRRLRSSTSPQVSG